MEQWLRSLIPWGTQVVAWVQAHSPGWLTSLAVAFTILGYEEVYLVLLPFVYWCISKPVGIGLGYISLLSAWANNAIKYIFNLPRPSGPGITQKGPRLETSPSFPSGHAQNAAADWGYLGVRFRSWLLRAIVVILILGIGLSRIVLGVHFPQDVIGGWVIGLVLLVVFSLAAPPVGRWVTRLPAWVQAILAVAVPVGLIFLHPAAEGHYPAASGLVPMAAMAGLGLGLVMERAWVRFSVEGGWGRRTVRLLVGLIIVAVLYEGPNLIVPSNLSFGLESAISFVRYALVGWAVAFFCPWVFVRLRLAKRNA